MIQIGILLFDRVEELDFAGPYEVLAAAQDSRPDDIEVRTYALDSLEITCNKRLKVTAHARAAEAPQLDVLLVPGGNGSRAAAEDPKLIDWVRTQALGCQWVTSAGVSAGIDMSFWLLGQLTSPAFAREVQAKIEYFPAPPYTAETE